MVELAGPERALRIAGVRMIGFDALTVRRLLLTVAFFAGVIVLAAILRAVVRLVVRDERRHARFIAQQAISLTSSVLLVIVFISIWFDDPGRLAGAAALVTAGLAIASQKLIMSLVGYFSILRGSTFKVGDRITMGGVRGDVVALSYVRTTIMEMGQPPAVEPETDPAMWVEARQYTGRIVTVTNDKVFDEPVYNFTREFPYLFEEMKVPIRYGADRAAAERILLEAATRHTVDVTTLSAAQLEELQRRYILHDTRVEPRVYFRMTDNWLELTLRFVVGEHGIREAKDAITRDVLDGLDAAGIEVASATFELTNLPALRLERHPAR
jgi:small-conductance mechanosensitive channel